jgi:Prohead core protein serine protease
MSNNTYSLLVEEPIYEVKYLIEEKNRNTPSILHIQGPFLMANEANKNKRVYPLEEMVREVNRYTDEMISTKRATGELNHPQSPEINLERVCHVVTELKQNGNIFEGKSKVLSTPMGQIVRSLIMDGVKLGVSSRALGRLEEDKNGTNRVADFRLVAVDVVADPSVPSAFVNGILESKQWILNENGEFAPIYDRFEKSIETLPKKQVDNYLKEQIILFINSLKTL